MKSARRTKPRPAVPAAPPEESRHAPGGWKRYALASAALLAPCFWQARIQAGDLGSHIYNAWLAELIRQGRAPGLSIVPQTTNVLFDLLLGALFRTVGSAAAQRIAVSLAVLVFVWGAFAFVAATARREWALLPAIAMLAYGWVFHMGFFDFYLSLGLCFWALALAWNPAPRRLLAAVPLLLVAYVAQALPVAWACAVLAFLWLARRLPAKRAQLMATAVLAICALHIVLSATMMTRWTYWQIKRVAGVDQAWVYDDKYWLTAAGLLLVWVVLGAESVRRNGARRFFGGDLFQVFAVTAAGVLLLPTWVWLPGYHHALVFISERMSLTMGVLVVALVAAAGTRRWQRWAIGLLAAVFFIFLYVDERALNGFEDQTRNAVAQLPPMARVVSNADADLRINALTHIIDRVCIGRCYSYANYEPSSGAFRIRVTGPTSIIAPTDMDSSRMQNGGYAVKERDLPLYRISVAPDGNLVVESMPAGELIGVSQWHGLWELP
ncbi:MAG: hypothetical protein WCB12_08415 [Bryobacteraceae bacterium]